MCPRNTEQSPPAAPGSPSPEILYEDNHLLCVYKPSGLLSQSGPEGGQDLLTLCREYVRARYEKPGQVYLGLVHRLDRATAGPMLFARTSKAAARLSEQFRQREVAKDYHALVNGRIRPPAAELRHFVAKDEGRRLSRVVSESTAGAREARLRYETLGTASVSKRALNELLFPEENDRDHVAHPDTKQHEISIVSVELLTGRFHQIRCQMSSIGHPLLGDVKYRSGFALRHHGLALECVRLEFTHPVKKETIVLHGKRLLENAFRRIAPG